MNEPIRPDDLRISDVDRTRVQDLLRRAHEAGQIDLGEFDERVAAVWAARTRGDLTTVTRDLPALPQPPSAAPRQVFSDTGGGVAMRVLTIIWLSLLVTNLMVWGILALTGVDAYFWPIWLLLPGGALAVLYGFGIGRPERPDTAD